MRKFSPSADTPTHPTARDPFVEWLLQGFAFLAARVQYKINQDFPRFTQNLLNVVSPQLTASTPSMMVAEIKPDFKQSAMLNGYRLPRDSPFQGELRGFRRDRFMGDVAIQFRSARTLMLWPLQIKNVAYLANSNSVNSNLGAGPATQSALTFSLFLDPVLGKSLSECGVQELDFFVPNSATGNLGHRLFAAVRQGQAEAFVRQNNRPGVPSVRVPLSIEPLGLDRHLITAVENRQKLEDEDYLLPYDHRVFDGHRLLHEFMALPERFLFFRLKGLGDAVRRCEGTEMQIAVRFDQRHPELEGHLDDRSLRLYCVPAINLFPASASDINVDGKRVDYPVVVDNFGPMEAEVHSVTKVIGRYSSSATNALETVEYKPFFAAPKETAPKRYYALNRTARRQPVTVSSEGGQNSQRGDEVSISLVDESGFVGLPLAGDEPAASMRLSVSVMATNRHLATRFANSGNRLTTDYGLETAAIVAGPSEARSGVLNGQRLWRAIGSISMNYLSLVHTENGGGAAALRQVLKLYSDGLRGSEALADAILEVDANLTMSRIKTDGGGNLNRPGSRATVPFTFARGIDIALKMNLEEPAAPTLAVIMERFLTGHARVNSFTRMRLIGDQGETIYQGPPRTGTGLVM